MKRSKPSCRPSIGLLFQALFLCALTLFMSGCSAVYRTTGNVLTQYSETEATPYLFASDDPQLVCSLSEAFSPFLFSFERVGASPEKLKILLYMMAGSCAETRSWDAELRYLRALRVNNATETQDARIEQKRFLLQAARRYQLSYKQLVDTMGDGEQCPKFKTKQDELLWLVGLLSGLQASFADLATEHQADVPLDTTQKIARAASCLDNTRWWGVPLAMQSAVATVLPGLDAEKHIALHHLTEASAIGIRSGVRLASVMEAQIYFSQGRLDEVKRVMREFVQADSALPDGARDMKLFDEVARLQMQAISDRLWTEAKGIRTPFNGLGTFWDDKRSVESESLLDGL